MQTQASVFGSRYMPGAQSAAGYRRTASCLTSLREGGKKFARWIGQDQGREMIGAGAAPGEERVAVVSALGGRLA